MRKSAWRTSPSVTLTLTLTPNPYQVAEQPLLCSLAHAQLAQAYDQLGADGGETTAAASTTGTTEAATGGCSSSSRGRKAPTIETAVFIDSP